MSSSTSPTLALDIASSSACALLHLQDSRIQGTFAFRSPSPGKVLAERIRACTALGRPLFLKGDTLDRCIVAPLLSHLEAGLPLYVQADYAALLAADPETLRGLGVRIAPYAPEQAVSIESRDISPEYWRNLVETAGLPRPANIFVSATEYGRLLDGGKVRPLASWLNALFRRYGDEGVPVRELVTPIVAPQMLRLFSIQRITGFSVLDSAIAFIYGMLALPSVAGRSRREGVVLLYMGKYFIRVALVYQGRMFALLELPAAGRSADGQGSDTEKNETGDSPLKIEELIQWLDDLRLGWLPAEKAVARNGFLCRAENFPAEAEGFYPLYVTGPEAILLEGRGQITDFGPEESANCRGLLAAFS